MSSSRLLICDGSVNGRDKVINSYNTTPIDQQSEKRDDFPPFNTSGAE